LIQWVGSIIMGGFMNIKLLVLFLVSLVGACCAVEEYFCVCGSDDARVIAPDVKDETACEKQDANKLCVWEKKKSVASQPMLVASRSSYM